MGFITDIREALNEPFNRYLVVILFLLGIFLLVQPQMFTQTTSIQEPIVQNQTQQSGFVIGNQPTNQTDNLPLIIHFFYLPTCQHCAAQSVFNAKLAKEFMDVEFIYHDVTNPNEVALLNKMALERGMDKVEYVPVTFFKNNSFIGFDSEETTGQKIREAIADCLKECKKRLNKTIIAGSEDAIKINLPLIGQIEPRKYSLPILAVILGLVDGFNPCAMWVLVYLIALVMNLNSKKKIWFIVGTFVLASGVIYFLIMTAWLNAFLIIGYMRAVTIIVGLMALGGGILSIREYIITKGNITCKVGDANDKKRTMSHAESIVSSPLTIATIGAIIVLAFVVNSAEFLCSAAIPATFTQILSLSNLLFWEYYGYIALYDFFFMLDDIIIFGSAAFAISSGLGEKYAKQCKIIGGVIMFILGILLLFMPYALR
ncbi:MAG: hypothetical protein AB1391_03700 [Candidatus Micrarchaeota archaeon]